MSLLFAYYGDDFTGSTDALEALAANGVRTVLFLGVPSAARCEQFGDYDAVGIAGESRSRDPEWMRRHLPEVFRYLRSLGAPVTQYKVCSTFDSSPQTGNIGVAMSIGRNVFESSYVPVVVAAPHLRRYVLFGSLFAGQGDAVYRIDRHPTMSRHPVTPMGESDLRLHLAQQTSDPVELYDLLSLTGAQADESFDKVIARGPAAVVFDGFDELSELATGRLLWSRRDKNPFVTGSSGLTQGLIRHWRASGQIPPQFDVPRAAAVDRVIVVSGSCSPVTDGQIRCAVEDGFRGFHTAAMAGDDLVAKALEVLARGQSVVIYSALGPHELGGGLAGEELGRYLGKMLRELMVRSGVRRAVIAGGDTASHAASQLGVHALTFAAPLAPGSPLCRAHSDDKVMDGVELVLKGGQVGKTNFFETVRRGWV
jgi:uncharacterized protein YgbK (DUF1537 family)